jgi:hypothetical protein
MPFTVRWAACDSKHEGVVHPQKASLYTVNLGRRDVIETGHELEVGRPLGTRRHRPRDMFAIPAWVLTSGIESQRNPRNFGGHPRAER